MTVRLLLLWSTLPLLCADPVPQAAPGDLNVSATLLTFEGHTRTRQITVQNTGRTRATYRLSLQHLRMTERGTLEEADTFPGSAAPMLRFSPHQVELEPGEIQTVRVQVRKPEHLEEGDYRIHLLFRAVPLEGPPPASVGGGLQIQLNAIPGIAVPIHILHGHPRPSVHLEGVKLAGGTLSATLVQRGKVGLRGQLVLLGGKPSRELGTLEVVHYGDLPRQLLTWPLQTPLPEGPLRLHLRDAQGKVLLELEVPHA